MSRKFIIISIFIIVGITKVEAQFIIKGKVTDTKSVPLTGVSISVLDSYAGSTSENSGEFSFVNADTGIHILQFSYMGYKTVTREVRIFEPVTAVSVSLKEEITEMKAVVVNAGTFEAGDKKRSTVLKSVDMVTTAGQQADIVAALKTLPGAQQIGEEEGLFIRGGTGNETKVFMDGMIITNPFFSSVPGIAQRSRFSPLLFKGTVFSSGGYSAQYGQALSSVLLLETIDLPSRSEINLIISSAQQSMMGQHLNKKKNSSVGFSINYTNLAPYFSVVKQKYDYTKSPELINGEFNIRKKLKTGMFKWYTYLNTNTLSFNRNSLDLKNGKEYFKIVNRNLFSTFSYSVNLKNRWHFYTGLSFGLNKDRINMNEKDPDTTLYIFRPELSNTSIHLKSVLTKTIGGLTKIYAGAEYQYTRDGIEAPDSIRLHQIDEHLRAFFIESDIYYSPNLVSKAGLRYEYSGLLNQGELSPRFSLAWKLNPNSQVSFAYGIFYQKPETNYLLRKSDLSFSKAIHYILNFQKIRDGQTFRTEAFYKKYSSLITTNSNPVDISNNGNGFAKGIEVFWRDKTSIKNLDYWISYSFLDTKRKFLNYPNTVQPSFAAKHTFSAVAKRFISAISTQFSTTFSYASGRPYYNPNARKEYFMNERTIAYHSLGLQANHLRSFGTINAVFILNVGNVLGTKQVFGYRYAERPDMQGQFASEALTPMAKRFIFLGMYLSIGSDRRKQILD